MLSNVLLHFAAVSANNSALIHHHRLAVSDNATVRNGREAKQTLVANLSIVPSYYIR